MNQPIDASHISHAARRQATRLASTFQQGGDAAKNAAARAAHTGRYQLDRLQGAATVAARGLRASGQRSGGIAAAAARRHPVATGAIVAVAAVGAAVLLSPRLRAAIGGLAHSLTAKAAERGKGAGAKRNATATETRRQETNEDAGGVTRP
jgi:hypothetical protein